MIMKKNKYLAISASVLALMSIGTPRVFAEEPSVVVASEESKSAELKYVVDEVYEWNIHSGIDFGKNKGFDRYTHVDSNNVAVTKNVLTEGSKLVIKVKGSGTNNAFTINNGGNQTLNYSIWNGERNLEVNDTVLEVASGTDEGTKTLNFTLRTRNFGDLAGILGDPAEIAGSYNGTITYTAEINGGSENTGGISGVTTGKVLNIEGKEYTVIEQVEGSKYKVLANELAKDEMMSFGSTSEYKTSPIATYLDNDYYNTLDTSIKNAIVETSIQQKKIMVMYGDNKNNPTWTGEVEDAGTHKIFLPSWDEFTKAACGTVPATLQAFLNEKDIWLRDIESSTDSVSNVYSDGSLCSEMPGNGFNYFVRPAFVLDLSKVNYTTK